MTKKKVQIMDNGIFYHTDVGNSIGRRFILHNEICLAGFHLPDPLHTTRENFEKRRLHSQNASNVFGPHYAGEI